jgi:predicted  nucleic acid-binding Zn-ribbon protein
MARYIDQLQRELGAANERITKLEDDLQHCRRNLQQCQQDNMQLVRECTSMVREIRMLYENRNKADDCQEKV